MLLREIVAVFLLLQGAGAAVEAYQIGCYVSWWSTYNGYSISQINLQHCTHVYYAFGAIDVGNIGAYTWDPNFYTNLQALRDIRTSRPSMKIILSLGGADPTQSAQFELAAQNQVNMDAFASNAVSFLRAQDLDGLDIDWETSWCSAAWDKAKHAGLLQALKTAFGAAQGSRRLLLTAALHTFVCTTPFYDVPKINSLLDIANVMTYDLWGDWFQTTGFHSNLLPATSADALSVDMIITYFLGLGMSPSLLHMGVPMYGRSFTLADGTQNGVGAPTVSAGTAGQISQSAGILFYREICALLLSGATRVYDSTRKAPYAFKGDQWVGYDDPQSVTEKASYIKNRQLGGTFFWAMANDDYDNSCGGGVNPLSATMAAALLGSPASTSSPSPASTTSSTTSSTTPSTTPSSTPSTAPSTTPTPSTTNSDAFVCPSNGLHADPSDCTKYYNCWQGTAYSMACNSNLYWNQQAQYCDWPSNVQCTEGGATPSPSATPPTTTTSTTTTTTRPSSSTFTCPSKFGYYADPDDCSCFYQCSHFRAYHFTCTSPLLWSSQKTTCDWSNNVQCK